MGLHDGYNLVDKVAPEAITAFSGHKEGESAALRHLAQEGLRYVVSNGGMYVTANGKLKDRIWSSNPHLSDDQNEMLLERKLGEAMLERHNRRQKALGKGVALEESQYDDSKYRPMAKLDEYLDRHEKKGHLIAAQMRPMDLSAACRDVHSLNWKVGRQEADNAIPVELRNRVADPNDHYSAEFAVTINNDSDDLLSIRASMARYALYYRKQKDEWHLLDRIVFEEAHGLTYRQQLLLKELGGSDYFRHLPYLGQVRIWRDYRHLLDLTPRKAIEEIAVIARRTRKQAKGVLWSKGQVEDPQFEAMLRRLEDGSAVRELELALDADLDRCEVFDIRNPPARDRSMRNSIPSSRTITLPHGPAEPKPPSSRLSPFPFSTPSTSPSTDPTPRSPSPNPAATAANLPPTSTKQRRPFEQLTVAEQRQIIKTSRRLLRTAPPVEIATRGPVAAQIHRVDRYGARGTAMSSVAREGIEEEERVVRRAARAKPTVRIRGFGGESSEDEEDEEEKKGKGRGRASAEHPGRTVHSRYTVARQPLQKAIRTNDERLRAADRQTTLNDPERLALCLSPTNLPPPGTNLNPLVQTLPAISTILSDTARCISLVVDVFFRLVTTKGGRSYNQELFEKPAALKELIDAMSAELKDGAFEEALKHKGVEDMRERRRSTVGGPRSRLAEVRELETGLAGAAVRRNRPPAGWTEGTAAEFLLEFAPYAKMVKRKPELDHLALQALEEVTSDPYNIIVGEGGMGKGVHEFGRFISNMITPKIRLQIRRSVVHTNDAVLALCRSFDFSKPISGIDSFEEDEDAFTDERVEQVQRHQNALVDVQHSAYLEVRMPSASHDFGTLGEDHPGGYEVAIETTEPVFEASPTDEVSAAVVEVIKKVFPDSPSNQAWLHERLLKVISAVITSSRRRVRYRGGCEGWSLEEIVHTKPLRVIGWLDEIKRWSQGGGRGVSGNLDLKMVFIEPRCFEAIPFHSVEIMTHFARLATRKFVPLVRAHEPSDLAVGLAISSGRQFDPALEFARQFPELFSDVWEHMEGEGSREFKIRRFCAHDSEVPLKVNKEGPWSGRVAIFEQKLDADAKLGGRRTYGWGGGIWLWLWHYLFDIPYAQDDLPFESVYASPGHLNFPVWRPSEVRTTPRSCSAFGISERTPDHFNTSPHPSRDLLASYVFPNRRTPESAPFPPINTPFYSTGAHKSKFGPAGHVHRQNNMDDMPPDFVTYVWQPKEQEDRRRDLPSTRRQEKEARSRNDEGPGRSGEVVEKRIPALFHHRATDAAPDDLMRRSKPIRLVKYNDNDWARSTSTQDGVPTAFARYLFSHHSGASPHPQLAQQLMTFSGLDLDLNSTDPESNIAEQLLSAWEDCNILAADPGVSDALSFNLELYDSLERRIQVNATISSRPLQLALRRRAQLNSQALNRLSSKEKGGISAKRLAWLAQHSRPWARRYVESSRTRSTFRQKAVQELLTLVGVPFWRSDSLRTELKRVEEEEEYDISMSTKEARVGKKQEEFGARSMASEIGYSHLISRTPRPSIFIIGDATLKLGKKGQPYIGNALLAEIYRQYEAAKRRHQSESIYAIVSEGLTTKTCMHETCVEGGRRGMVDQVLSSRTGYRFRSLVQCQRDKTVQPRDGGAASGIGEVARTLVLSGGREHPFWKK